MKNNNKNKIEAFNTFSHLFGVLIGLLGILFLNRYIKKGSTFIYFSLYIYLLCFIFLFLSSSLYHLALWKEYSFQNKLRVLDHSAIFIFIAGTYTPLLAYIFSGQIRILLLVLVWLLAFAGVLYKNISKANYDRQKTISLFLYISMGWLSLFLIRKIYLALGWSSIIYLVLGGVTYSLGTIFYKNNKLIYHHVIWHFFVLIAAILHFIPIYHIALLQQ